MAGGVDAPQDSRERALVGERRDPVEEKRRARLASLLVSLDTADAFIDVPSEAEGSVVAIGLPQILTNVCLFKNSPLPAFPTNLPFSTTALPRLSTALGTPFTLIPSNIE